MIKFLKLKSNYKLVDFQRQEVGERASIGNIQFGRMLIRHLPSDLWDLWESDTNKMKLQLQKLIKRDGMCWAIDQALCEHKFIDFIIRFGWLVKLVSFVRVNIIWDIAEHLCLKLNIS